MFNWNILKFLLYNISKLKIISTQSTEIPAIFNVSGVSKFSYLYSMVYINIDVPVFLNLLLLEFNDVFQAHIYQTLSQLQNIFRTWSIAIKLFLEAS